MRTQAEIEQILIDTQSELDYVNDWVGKAYEKYKAERWYESLSADDSEWRAACDAQKVLIEKINVLNWVLDK